MLDDTELAAYVAAALTLHELHLEPARQAAVTEQFRLLAGMAQQFMDQPEVAEEEPAPVYRL